ncbi:hypothetical protein EDD15DRAFT_2202421 [Pisolithus albus]|nr:hypothetical protein EDD15DRAFT_2202421 [Pisolithus albus]
MSREVVVSEKFPLGFLVLQGIVTLQLEVFEFGDETSLGTDASVATAKDRVGRIECLECAKSLNLLPVGMARNLAVDMLGPSRESFGGVTRTTLCSHTISEKSGGS